MPLLVKFYISDTRNGPLQGILHKKKAKDILLIGSNLKSSSDFILLLNVKIRSKF